MDIETEIRGVLDEVLSLKGRSSTFSAATPLLGSVPELDSMAVASVLTALEERFGIIVEDDEIEGSTFETFGSLVEFVRSKFDG